jgi:NAD(P)-dependent dehydrogenase (short-subunit alcohol dehydrogenase family)
LGQHSGGSTLEEGEEALSRRINGRHVVITGGNSGIGRATAMALAGMGMNVTLGKQDSPIIWINEIAYKNARGIL